MSERDGHDAAADVREEPASGDHWLWLSSFRGRHPPSGEGEAKATHPLARLSITGTTM